jgi:hypothetical protein
MALKPARARLAPPPPDPGIEGAEETNFAISPGRDDMIAEQQPQAAQQPSGADVQQSQTEVQPLQEAQPAAAADAPFDPPPAKSEPEPASIRRTPIGEVAPPRAGAKQEMADIVAEESTSSVNPSIENPPQPRERPAVTKRRARPKSATRRLPGTRARQILAAQRIPPAQRRSAAAAIPSPGPDSGAAAAASRTTTFMQNGSH